MSSISWFMVGSFILRIEFPGHFWNALTRLAIFIIFIYMVNAYKRERIFAREDFLTKIANNQHFAEIAGMEIERCRRYGRPFSLVYIDVDNFKAVNDNFGHSTGNTAALRGCSGHQAQYPRERHGCPPGRRRVRNTPAGNGIRTGRGNNSETPRVS